MYTVLVMICEGVFELYGCCNVRDSAVVHRVSVYADMLETGKGLIEYPVCQPVSITDH